jgi:hypothetical protein
MDVANVIHTSKVRMAVTFLLLVSVKNKVGDVCDSRLVMTCAVIYKPRLLRFLFATDYKRLGSKSPLLLTILSKS